MKWVKFGAVILVAVITLGMIVYGFIPKPIPSEFATVRQDNISVTIDEEARTRVKDRFTIYAPVAGETGRIPFKPGDEIKAGQVITVLKPARPPLMDARARQQAEANISATTASVEQAKANVTAAEAEKLLAEKEHNRMKELLLKRHVSQEQLDVAQTREQAAVATLTSAEFARDAAQWQLEMAKAALIDYSAGDIENIEITSPVAGRVLQVFRESAGPVLGGAMLLELGDAGTLEVVAELLSTDAVRVKPDMKVEIARWGGEGDLKGIVRKVEPFGFTEISALGVEEQRVNVIIDFADAPEKYTRLGDGYRVEARIVVTERRGVLSVPEGAIFDGAKGPSVFVVKDGKAVETSIQIGQRSGVAAEILSGVSKDAQVILHPSDEIKDGHSVTER